MENKDDNFGKSCKVSYKIAGTDLKLHNPTHYQAYSDSS